MANELYLTPEGKLELEKKLHYYKTVERPKAIEAIGTARDFGDLKENSEYDQAKEYQGKIESEIQQMESILRDAIIISKKAVNTSVVSVGTKIKLLDITSGDTFEYKIVGTTESNPLKGLISNESPVAKAILNKKKDDEVKVQTPGGVHTFKILEINA